MKERALSNVVWLYAVQAVTLLLPLLLLPYLTRTLGLGGYGKFAFAQVCAQFLVSVSELGLPLIAAREIKGSASFGTSLSVNYTTFHSIAAYSTIVASLALIMFALFMPFDDQQRSAMMAASLIILSSGITPVWLFQGLGRLKMFALASLCAKFVTFVLIFSLVKSERDVLTAMMSLSAPPVLISSGLLFYLWRGRVVKFRARYLRMRFLSRSFKQALHVFSGGIFTYIFTYGTTFLLRWRAGDAGVALYLASDRLSGACRSLFMPIVQGSYTSVSSLYRAGSIEAAQKRVLVIGGFIVCLAVCMVSFVWLVPPSIFSKIFGHSFSGVTHILRIQMLSQLAIGVGMVVLNLVIIGSGNQSVLKGPYMIAAALHLVHASILTHVFGAAGAAMSVLITEALVTTLLIFTCIRHRILVFHSSSLRGEG